MCESQLSSYGEDLYSERQESNEKLLKMALVMVDIFNTSIESGVYPVKGSPCHDTIHDILNRGNKTPTWSDPKFEPIWKDKYGIVIKEGNILFNEFNSPEYVAVLADEDGKLYLGDMDTPFHQRYQFHEFWEVAKLNE